MLVIKLIYVSIKDPCAGVGVEFAFFLNTTQPGFIGVFMTQI